MIKLKGKLMKIKLLEGGTLPSKATSGAACYDVYARQDLYISPGYTALVPLGFSIQLPEDRVALILPRSGMAYKHRVTVLNAPGVIDSDYRGECMAMLMNHGDTSHTITAGERVAQMMIVSLAGVVFEVVTKLDETTRANGGFGSTGR
tara:strand:+ start:868 stop:1311 length:444 start_codon:yes stop_codon:yes gene_type:complete